MPIDPDAAAEVARRHGLTLSDAAALQQLADDPDHADEIAGRFATGSDPVRRWLADMRDDTNPTHKNNTVPTEGGNPVPPDPPPADPQQLIEHLTGLRTRRADGTWT